MTLDKAIKIKEHNRHMGILCPTDKEFEADDLSIEAIKRLQVYRNRHPELIWELLPGETT